ncbi:MAG: TlpA disulfide reductase family protein [Gammaproteobacteria bacterium]
MKYIYSSIIFSLIVITTAIAAEKQTLPALEKPIPAPDFNLKGEDGKWYKLSEMKGKVVVMNFWATWCPPCRYEMPALERLWEKVKDKNIIILGINVGEDADTIFEFTGTYPMSFPVPMDIDGKVIEQYPIRGLPTTYVINPQGMVTHRAVGSRNWDEEWMVNKLKSLL